jgi:subtilisin family serine protease
MLSLDQLIFHHPVFVLTSVIMPHLRSFPRRTSDAHLRPQYEQLERRVLLASDLQLALKSYSDYEQPTAAWFSRIDHAAVEAATIAAGGTSTEWFHNFVGPRRYQQHDWIVRLTPAATASLQMLDELPSKLNQSDISFRVVAGLGLPGLVHVQSLSNSEESVRTSLSNNDRIASFSANEKVGGQLFPNDSSFGNMTNLHNVGQFNATPDADIDLPEAWDRTTGSTKVVVGVIDSGVDAAHPDLYLNMWLNQGEIPATFRSLLVETDGDGLITFYDLNQSVNSTRVRDLNSNGYIDAIDLLEDPLWADGRDTDGNGFVDDFFGWNFRTDSNEPFAPNNPSDNLGHGTHVAGTIGAIGNNGRGISGINWRSSIMALKFLDQSNQGELASAISAIHYATMMRTQFGTNVRVLNNSWGQPGGENTLLRDAISESGEAGILFVAAAGNGNILGQGVDNDRVPFYPASYDLPNVISVAASDPNDRLATFSNFGLRSVDIAAPGVGVLSTLPGGQYGEANGTSMATPHVSGVAALIWSDQLAATPDEVIKAMNLGSDSKATFEGRVASGRRLNAPAALNTQVFAPAAIVVSAPNITTASNQAQEITIRYSHRDGINAQTIGDNDIAVVRRWGPEESFYPTLKSGSVVADGNGFRATYVLSAPGGNWDPLDYGPYELQIQRKAVYGTQGLAVREGAVGQFRVKIDDPSVLYVNTTSDTLDANVGDGFALDASGKTSLRAAIMEANAAGTVARTIILDPGFYNLSIAPVPDANFQFMVPGPGATVPPGPPGWSDVRSGDLDVHGTLSIFGDDDGTSVIDAQLLDRVFKVHPNATLNLSRVAAQYGRAPAGQDGGAILSAGTLNVSLSTIAYSTTQHSGGGIAVWQGSVNVSQSTIWHNNAQSGGGMLLSNNSTMNIDTSTLAFNEAPLDGGAILSWFGGGGQIVNSTISSNNSEGTSGIAALPYLQGHHYPVSSASDEYVVFSSNERNLIPGKNNNYADIFLYDLQTQNIERITGSYLGGESNGDSREPSTSVDGRFVAFQSGASNLIPGDTNEQIDIFVYDRLTRATERVNVSNSGEQARGYVESGRSISPSLSANGRFVAFVSGALNLVPGDTNFRDDIFVFDRLNRTIERVSVSSSGDQGNSASYRPSISGDGRFIAFSSYSSNLVPGDTNNTYDVFVFDRDTRSVERVSVSNSGQQGNGWSEGALISADGRFVTFSSNAQNLIPNDMNNTWDTFVFDRRTQTIELASVSSTGQQAQDGVGANSMTIDGRFLVAESWASNLVPGDTNGKSDIFVFDRQSRTTERVSVPNHGGEANHDSRSPSISPNGRYITFNSDASNLIVPDTNSPRPPDVFIYDREERKVVQVGRTHAEPIWVTNVTLVENRGAETILGEFRTNDSLFAGNQQVTGGPAVDWGGDASRNGGYPWWRGVYSNGFNIVNGAVTYPLEQGDRMVSDAMRWIGPLQDNGGPTWTHALLPGSPALDAGNPASSLGRDQRGTSRSQDGDGYFGARADIGAFEAYQASIQGSVFLDRNRNGFRDATEPGLARWAVYLDSNKNDLLEEDETVELTSSDDLDTQTTNEQGRFRIDVNHGNYLVANQIPSRWSSTRVERGRVPILETAFNEWFGGDIPGFATGTAISADGRFIAFSTDASNLVPGDTNNQYDVFVYDRQNRSIERVSVSSSGQQSNNWSGQPSISADGRFVGFNSMASNLVPGDTNNDSEIFVYDRQMRTIERVNISNTGEQGNLGSFGEFSGKHSISSDGRYVAFSSWASNLVPGDTNNAPDIFVHDRHLRTTERVSVSNSGGQGNDFSKYPSISADGRFVAFASAASNLTPGAPGVGWGIFVFDRQTRTTERISRGFGETSINADGRYVAFSSDYTDLVPGDTNQCSDIFLYDRQARTIERVNLSNSGDQGDSGSGYIAISADGRFITYGSSASSLVPGDTNNQFDIFLYDRQSRLTESLSVSLNGALANGRNYPAAVSADGRFVSFLSEASNLVSGDKDKAVDLFFLGNKRAPSIFSQSVGLHAGQVVTGIDFGVVPDPGEIRGTAFMDALANGVFDPGEPVRAGTVVYLDLNGNGRRETTEPTTTTGADGRYAFQNLDAEMEYFVATEVPAGFSLITPSTQSQGTWKVYVPAGGTIADRDFGFVPINTGGQFENGTLSGRIFQDINGDGIPQTGESGVPNITVYLDLNNNEARDFNEPRTLSDPNGIYSFAGLGNRAYTVRTVLPTGTSQSSPLGSKFSITTLPLTSASTQLANPQDILAEDLNGDGWPDLAAALYSGNNVSIRLNNGSGGFTAAPINVSTAPEGLGPIAIATGKLNAGDAFDLITANQLNGTSTIFLDFNGTGFASNQTLAVGNQPTDVVLGRFDEDSDFDAIVALKGTNQLVMLVNNGAGSFTKGAPFSSGGNQPTALVTGFFNNDSFLDIAVANYGTHPSGADFGNVAVLLGRGNGTFDSPVSYTVGFGPISIASGDFNGDGFVDLVTANFLANTATVLYGSATGTFTVDASALGVGQGPLQVTVADIEGDGDRDILVTNLMSQSISILRNRRSQGGSGFEPAESFGVAEFQTAPRLAFAAADFDRNTTTDIALVNSFSESLRIFRNTLVNGAQRIQSTGVDNLNGLNFGTRADVLLPTITPITNPEPIVEDSPQQVIELTGVAKGREGGPTLRITATSSDMAIVPTPTVAYVAGQSTGQLRYTPSENQFGQATITVTLRDAGADQTMDTADDGVVSRIFTVTIRPVNDAPTFSMPRSLNRLEDSSAQTIGSFVTGISPGAFETSQTLSPFSVAVDKPALFSVAPAVDPDGTFRFTPAPNAAGTAIVTVSLTDNGDTAYGGVKTRSDQFLLILDPVNDAPSINLGGNQTAQVGAASRTVSNFATGFSPGGGPDETTQTIAGFVIGVDKPELFSVLPAISNSGTLTYTPSSTRTGTAVVSVQVRDSGGSANGGMDLSLIKTFEITVTALPDTTPPTPTVSATVPNPTNQSSFDLAIDFGELVTGFALTDLMLTNATVSDVSDLGNGKYGVRLTATANGSVSASIPANAVKDLAGNDSLASATFTRTIDILAPTVSIATNETNPTERLSFPITIQFSEPVLGFESSDVVLGNATLSNWSEPQPGRFTATLNALSDGVVFVGFSAGVANDAAGNPNSSPSPLIHSVNSGTSSYKPLLTTTERSPSPNKNWTAELDFGRVVTGFEASDLQITHGSATISDLGGGKYRINLVSSVEGDVRVTMPANRVIDANNRPNDASDPVTIRYVDTTNSDFGDAPVRYPTLLADNGPFHRRTALFLGTQIDAEPNGQSSVNATGDNTNGVNDEDGIVFPMTLIVSSTTTTQSSYVVTSSGAGRMDAWIDFNGDGDWSDSGEQIANALAIPAGRSIQSFTLPAGVFSGITYARFRLSSVGGLNVTGPAVDGEVEDYAVTLVGGAGKEWILQATELGAHQISVVGSRILIENQGAIYSDVPMAQIIRVQGIETGGLVRYDLTGIGGGLPGTVRYPGSAGMVSLAGTASTIDVTQYGAQKLNRIEVVDLQSSESSTLLVTPADVREINGAKRLRVLMNANDSLATTATWVVASGRLESGVWIQPYVQGDATLEVVGARPWRNEVIPFDIDSDRSVSPLDVLTLINAINSNTFPGGTLPTRSNSSPAGFYDPDGDGSLSPLDVLAVVNDLNRTRVSGGEGESSESMEELLASSAIDQVMMEDMEELFPTWRSTPQGGLARPRKLTITR